MNDRCDCDRDENVWCSAFVLWIKPVGVVATLLRTQLLTNVS